jgi:two-component system chemotaxis sensor kinase CheA
MELSQYAELFLSESREHVSAINHLLLTLESDPRSRDAVEGLLTDKIARQWEPVDGR